MQTIQRNDLVALIDLGDRLVLIEALPETYYRKGHLPGAIHLPHDQVRRGAAGLPEDKSAPIVVYCASATCKNSHVAAKALSDLGYTDVRVYLEGKKDWQDAGLPLVEA